MSERCYLQRVRNPQPMLQQLAEQAVDKLETIAAPGDGRPTFFATAITAREFGVPFDYVLDEVERRARGRATSHA